MSKTQRIEEKVTIHYEKGIHVRVAATIVQKADRLQNEYNVEIRMDQLPYEHVRWIENEDIDVNSLSLTSDAKRVKDFKERPLLLFTHPWSIQTVLDRNEGLILSEVSQNNE